MTQFCPPPPFSLSSIPGSSLEYKNEIMNKIQSRKGLDSVLIKFNVTSLGRGALYILPVYPIPLFFFRQRKGEFVPDKNYPTPHSKQNGEAVDVDDDVDNIASFNDVIDPSTPRITDVPHKPTRAQSSSGGGPGGAKKSKKPMGVKVTYKPPKWD